jgi:hypothetical protein
MDVAARARAIDRLPLAHGFGANLDRLAFSEEGERPGSPVRGSEAWSAIAARARDVGRGDRLPPGLGPA